MALQAGSRSNSDAACCSARVRKWPKPTQAGSKYCTAVSTDLILDNPVSCDCGWGTGGGVTHVPAQFLLGRFGGRGFNLHCGFVLWLRDPRVERRRGDAGDERAGAAIRAADQ